MMNVSDEPEHVKLQTSNTGPGLAIRLVIRLVHCA